MTPAALALAPPPASLIAAGNAVLLGTHPSVDATLHRVRPGVYAPAQAWDDLTPWSRYLLRVHALHLIRPGCVFSHESAAALMGLPLFGHPRHLHLFDARRDRSLSYGDVRVHTSADPRRTQTVAGIHLTSVADTVIDLDESSHRRSDWRWRTPPCAGSASPRTDCGPCSNTGAMGVAESA